MGLKPSDLSLPEESIVSLIKWYCREAGVRNLQKHIERICRKVALKVVQTKQDSEALLSEAAAKRAASDAAFAAAAAAAAVVGNYRARAGAPSVISTRPAWPMQRALEAGG